MNIECCWFAAIHAEMKEGILASQTDYASKPLRDHLKRMLFIYFGFPLYRRYAYTDIICRGCAESQSSFLASTGKCVKSTEVKNYAWCI